LSAAKREAEKVLRKKKSGIKYERAHDGERGEEGGWCEELGRQKKGPKKNGFIGYKGDNTSSTGGSGIDKSE